MRYAATLAIAATALAAALTVVAVRTLGVAVEAHPVTRLAAVQVGLVGYVVLSIAIVAIGIRLLALLPFAEWGVRAVALAKVADATRDAWLVAHHPAIGIGAVGDALPALAVIAATALLVLPIVRGGSAPRPRLTPEVAT